MDDLSTYALALDGDKRPCRVRSSNAGQCLFSGIASAPRVRQTKETLLSPALLSGWGVRTLATNERRYNPMSYHNGSVWPHDNALIAFGDAASRDKQLAIRILSSLLDLSVFTELHRLPEPTQPDIEWGPSPGCAGNHRSWPPSSRNCSGSFPNPPSNGICPWCGCSSIGWCSAKPCRGIQPPWCVDQSTS